MEEETLLVSEICTLWKMKEMVDGVVHVDVHNYFKFSCLFISHYDFLLFDDSTGDLQEACFRCKIFLGSL